MAEWWVNKSNQNFLQGVEGDMNNPPRLPASLILDFLLRIREARESFLRLFPGLLPEEQERLYEIYRHALAQTDNIDPVITSDAIQHKHNTSNIRTSGRYGGQRRGGNV